MEQKKRGSAIIIALLLITAIGAIAFSFGRLFLAQMANYTILENGIGAYYAAESGIEEGLLRYKHNKNSEVPYGVASNSVTFWNLNNDNVFRSNLSMLSISTGASSQGLSRRSTTGINDSNQIYDLRMGYIGFNKKPFYGNDVDGNNLLGTDDILSSIYAAGDKSVLSIKKDEATKIDLSNLEFTAAANKDIALFANFTDFNKATDQGENMIQAKVLMESPTGLREFKTILSSNLDKSCTILGRSGDMDACKDELTQMTDLDGGNAWHNNTLLSAIRSKTSMPIPLAGNKITLFLKPLFHGAKIGLVYSNCLNNKLGNSSCIGTKQNVIAGPYSTVTSTGYYGGITKTLEANIDRQSGTIYDLYDYVVYQASN